MYVYVCRYVNRYLPLPYLPSLPGCIPSETIPLSEYHTPGEGMGDGGRGEGGGGGGEGGKQGRGPARGALELSLSRTDCGVGR